MLAGALLALARPAPAQPTRGDGVAGVAWRADRPGAPDAAPLVARPSGPAAPDDDGMPQYAFVALATVAAATGNQAVAIPSAWRRTWDGYVRRLGDQAGFALVEEAVRLPLAHALPWRPDPAPCDAGGAARVACAASRTFTLRAADGSARPNVPFLAGTVVASATSLAWRPERASAAKGRAFVASRIAVVLGASVATRVVTEWWETRRCR